MKSKAHNSFVRTPDMRSRKDAAKVVHVEAIGKVVDSDLQRNGKSGFTKQLCPSGKSENRPRFQTMTYRVKLLLYSGIERFVLFTVKFAGNAAVIARIEGAP